jgi:hypothetical protein
MTDIILLNMTPIYLMIAQRITFDSEIKLVTIKAKFRSTILRFSTIKCHITPVLEILLLVEDHQYNSSAV